MEFELKPNGRLRYANNSNYKNDIIIRKEGERLLRRRLARGTTVGHMTNMTNDRQALSM